MSVDSSDVALKYVELARSEIMAKVGFVNQTLGAYLLGTSALASWFYQSVYKVDATGKTLLGADKAMALIGLALMLGYLALGANWLIHHNERVVAALALYQKKELAAALPAVPKLWEQSDALKNFDGRWHAMVTIVTEELIILTPPVIALLYARAHLVGAEWWPLQVWLPATEVALGLNVVIAGMMLWTRWGLRGK